MNLPFLSELSIGWRDLCDIGIVTLVFFRLITIIRGTRMLAAIYGVIILVAVYLLADKIGFYSLHWLLNNFLGSFFLVLVIIFQNDLRRAFTEVGSRNIITYLFGQKKSEATFVDDFTSAVFKMAEQRVGALIVIEGDMRLGDLLSKGVMLNADISSELLQAIFYPKNPLHDGAVIIRDNKILAAGCILPLSSRLKGKRDFGTRHRAALGISEETDALAVVVSEERGEVSLSAHGTLKNISAPALLKRELWASLEAE